MGSHNMKESSTSFIVMSGFCKCASGLRARAQKFVEAVEAMTGFEEGQDHPQGAKTFNGKTHQVFGHQFISKVEGGKLMRVHKTAIEDGQYPDAVDYSTQSF